MSDKLEDFVPESMKTRTPAEQAALREFYRHHKAGGGGFIPFVRGKGGDSVLFDAVARFFTLLAFGLLLVFVGWLVLGFAGPGGLAVWVVCLVVGTAVLDIKSQDKMHLLWPGFLGPIGLVVVLVLPNLEKEARARSAAEADRALRQEELRVQKEILEELKRARDQKGQ